ncbi:MAG: hypothetical protein RR882_06675 [Comamonas sp.]
MTELPRIPLLEGQVFDERDLKCQQACFSLKCLQPVASWAAYLAALSKRWTHRVTSDYLKNIAASVFIHRFQKKRKLKSNEFKRKQLLF